jgi:DNA-binding MarR family transcriptional regulator
MQPTADDLVDALARTAFDVMQVITRVANAHDLSLTQVRVMGILRDTEPRLSDLADYVGVDRSSMSGLIDRAERRGLLQRRPDDQDGRASRVSLTASGRTLAERAAADVREGISPLVAHLTAAERATMTRLLAAR